MCRSSFEEKDKPEIVFKEAQKSLRYYSLINVVCDGKKSWNLLTSAQRKEMGEIFEQLLRAADMGNADAQFELNYIHEHDHSGCKSETEALSWYEKAAYQGHADNRATYTEAFRWCGKAAQQGNVHCQFSLGFMYSYGMGMKQSDTEAVRESSTARVCRWPVRIRRHVEGRGLKQSDIGR